MFEENNGAFASGDRGILFLAVESPGQAAIAEITKERLDGGINRGSYSIADVPANRGADFVNGLADLTEYAFDLIPLTIMAIWAALIRFEMKTLIKIAKIMPITKPITNPIRARLVLALAMKKPATQAPIRMAKETKSTKSLNNENERIFL